MIQKHRGPVVVLAMSVFFLAAPAVLAQDTVQGEDAAAKLLVSNWIDFLHYIKIALPEVAKSFGEAVLDPANKPGDVYRLSVKSKDTHRVLVRGAGMPELRETVRKIRKKIEIGYQHVRSDPAEIKNSIEMLPRSARAYAIAAGRLKHSGEFALPQLIQKLMDPETSDRSRECVTTVLPRMAEDADVTVIAGLVRGLSEALKVNDPALQEILATTLARIRYPHAAPWLKELAEREGLLDRTREVVLAALVACAGEGALDKSVSGLFYDTALKYYYQAESVAPDRRYEKANVWYWKEGLGLTYKATPREIFCDVYAMRLARLALKHDDKFYPAVSLWIDADLKRASDLPDGATDPTRGADQPSARFFALASGSKFLQDVLTRALNDRNLPVAVGAIEALAGTAGSESLVKPVLGGVQPLVQALTYPDRKVRFLAAVTLANALPEKRFAGFDQVVYVLNNAIRQSGRKIALLVVEDSANRNLLKDAARSAGYEVIDQPDPLKALSEARASTGVDVVILGAKPAPIDFVRAMRGDSVFVGTPAIVAAQSKALRKLAESDKRVVLLERDFTAEAVAGAVTGAVASAVGKPLTPEQAAEWAIRAARAIRKLGITNNAVFRITRSRPVLIAALTDGISGVRIAAAEALAVMSAAEAQQAVADLAVDDAAGEEVRIKAFNALSDSLRRFGNQLTNVQSQAVLTVVMSKSSEALREAAAQALGSMNLPSDQIKALILQTASDG